MEQCLPHTDMAHNPCQEEKARATTFDASATISVTVLNVHAFNEIQMSNRTWSASASTSTITTTESLFLLYNHKFVYNTSERLYVPEFARNEKKMNSTAAPKTNLALQVSGCPGHQVGIFVISARSLALRLAVLGKTRRQRSVVVQRLVAGPSPMSIVAEKF